MDVVQARNKGYSVKYAEHGSATLYLNHTGGSGGAGSSTMTLLEVLA